MHPRRLEKNANIYPLNRRCSRKRFSHREEERPDGSNYGADAAIMLYATWFTLVSSVGKKEARFRSSDLSARKSENPALGSEKLNSPQA